MAEALLGFWLAGLEDGQLNKLASGRGRVQIECLAVARQGQPRQALLLSHGLR